MEGQHCGTDVLGDAAHGVQHDVVVVMQAATSGGSSDTDGNELAAMPIGATAISQRRDLPQALRG